MDEPESIEQQKCNTTTPARHPGQWKPGETPPGAKPWKPGQSGNPKGRPKHRHLADDLIAALDDPVDADEFLKQLAKTLKLDPKTATVRQVIVRLTLFHAVKGNQSALKELWDRVDGRSVEHIALEDATGPKIVRLPVAGPAGGDKKDPNGTDAGE